MREYRVLFVDDERQQFEPVERLADEIDGLVAMYAGSQDEALDLIVDNFFHLAIVDVSLRGQAREDTDGIFLLQLLRDARPSCERLLITTLDNENRPEVLHALAPPIAGMTPLAVGYVDKAEPELRATEVVGDRAKAWLRGSVELHGIEDVLEHVQHREVVGTELSPHHGPIRPSLAEIDSLLSTLFGQGRRALPGSPDTVDSVELSFISEGWSRSASLSCVPSVRGRPGPRCLVKIGPRADALEEVGRYDSYVRFGLGLNHRVELLASAFGDALGAACYTHSETRGELHHDLQHLFNDEDPLAIEALERLFDADAQLWVADQSTHQDIARFFEQEYGRKVRSLASNIRRFCDTQDGMAMLQDGESVLWAGAELPMPRVQDLGLGAFSGEYAGCIVHGDLHGGNILVSGSGQPILIDYRNMTRGPRPLDFVSLEVSVRMAATAVTELASSTPGEIYDRERAAWREDWSAAPGEHGDRPYWREVSSVLRGLARANFPDLSPVEYAATALLRALRVMCASAPEIAHRRRLLPYVGILTEVIRSRDGDT